MATPFRLDTPMQQQTKPSRALRIAAMILTVAAVTAINPGGLRAETNWLDPASIVPSDTALYIQIDNLPAIRESLESQPLLSILESQLPHRRNPEAWTALQDLLGLSEAQIIEKYFGRTLLIVASDLENSNAALLSSIEPADADRLVEKLNLRPERSIGPFTVYRSEQHGRIALSDRWLVIADSRTAPVTRRILAGIQPAESLGQHTPFTHTFDQMEARNPAARVYAHNLVNNETHAAAATIDSGRFTIDYLGRSAEIAEGLSIIGDAASIDSTVLLGPDAPLAVFSINTRDERNLDEAAALFDRLIAPKTFKRDVLPKIDPPVTVFLDQLDTKGLPRPPAHPVPVLGVAVRLNDPSVADDLDIAFNNLASFFNIMTLEWQTPPLVLRTVNSKHGPYHVAEIGQALAHRSGFPELEPIARITYGRSGQHYVITTHED